MISDVQSHHPEQEETAEMQRALEHYWDRQAEAHSLMLNNPREFLGRYIDLFKPRQQYKVFCVDDRILIPADTHGNRVGAIRIAGSTVLQSRELKQQTVQNFKREGLNVVGVPRHNGCGAEGIARKNGMTPETIAKQAPELAELLGIPYQEEFAPMLPHATEHVARGLIVAGTRDLNSDLFEEQFTPLIISARYTPMTSEESAVSVGIAFGPHNFDSQSLKGERFPVTIIGDSENPEYTADKLADKVYKGLKSDPDASKLLKWVEINSVDQWDLPSALAA